MSEKITETLSNHNHQTFLSRGVVFASYVRACANNRRQMAGFIQGWGYPAQVC